MKKTIEKLVTGLLLVILIAQVSSILHRGQHAIKENWLI